jgi:hypothetical protein
MKAYIIHHVTVAVTFVFHGFNVVVSDDHILDDVSVVLVQIVVCHLNVVVRFHIVVVTSWTVVIDVVDNGRRLWVLDVIVIVVNDVDAHVSRSSRCQAEVTILTDASDVNGISAAMDSRASWSCLLHCVD